MARYQYDIGDVVLGNWTLVKFLGKGSYGKVFEAHREEYGSTYKAAIKIITIPYSQSEVRNARAEGMSEESIRSYFQGMVSEIVQEFALMSRLKGTAHVVSYEDHAVIAHENEIGWDILIRMELLTPLLDYMGEKQMTRSDIIKMGTDVCKALEMCQKYNIIHRDIKPENMFVSEFGDYKLGDFGVARTIEKTTGTLSKKGTYTYMAPEVYREEAYGSSVDMYSLGIVMYRLLNYNRAPFLPLPPQNISHSDREAALLRRVSGEALPKPANADGRLAEIVLKACAYFPENRYSSPMLMRQELEAIWSSRGEERVIYPKSDPIEVHKRDYSATPRTKVEDWDDNSTGWNVPTYRDQQKEIPQEKNSCPRVPGKFPKRTVGAVLAVVCLVMVAVIALADRMETSGDTVGTVGITDTTEVASIPDTVNMTDAVNLIPAESSAEISLAVGDVLPFGAYEQDGIPQNGPEAIEWLVLDVQGNQALLLSRYALDAKPYDESYRAVTWEDCTLRTWLNGEFLNIAFTREEQTAILLTDVDNSRLQGYSGWHTDGGNNTQDKIFLLSDAEAWYYFYSDVSRRCAPTAYAVAMGADTRTTNDDNAVVGWWWLRSPGENAYSATYVNYDGSRYSNAVANDYVSVRPAVWIRLDP